MLRAPTVEVGPHRDHDRDRALWLEHGSGQGVKEGLPFGVVRACGEDLLELIDRDHRAARATQLRRRPIQLLHRMVPGADYGVRPTIAPRQGARPKRMEETSSQERRLPAAGRTHECKEPTLDQVSDRVGNHVLTAEEERGIVRLESGESLVGADVDPANRLGMRRRLQIELGIVIEDRGLHPLEIGTGLDPELVHQHGAGTCERLERLGLAPGPIQGKHELAPSTFTQWFLSNHPLEVGDERARVAVRELGIDAILDRRSPELFEAFAL